MSQNPVISPPEMQKLVLSGLPPMEKFGDPGAIVAQSQYLMSSAIHSSGAIASIADGLQVPVITPVFPTIPTAPLPVTLPDPTTKDITWTEPVQPIATYGDLPDLDGLLPGLFTDTPPTLTFGTPPTKDYGGAPDAPQVDLNITLPDLPVLNIPNAPDFMALQTVPFDPVTLPTFDAELPVLRVSPPNIVGYAEGPTYTSTLLDMLKGDLESAISNGTGLSIPTPALRGIFDQARENEYRTMADAIDDLDRMETMGFSLPPGAYTDARIKITTETQNKFAGLNRDIMVKQADLTLTNLMKCREDAAALEVKLIDYANSVAQRAFEAAKYQTEAMIQLYNGQINAYTATMEGYKARAQVYDYQIRGALAIAEIYKTRIEAESVKAQINTALVQRYKTQVDAALANVEIYKAELQGVEIATNLQKAKIEVFGEQIKAYVGRIQAFSAEVEAYKTGVQAQGTVQETYTARVQAYKATVDAGVAQINGKVEGYKAKIGGYQASLDGYKSAIEGMVGKARAIAEYNTSAAEVYRAKVQGIASYNDVVTKQWGSAVEIAEKEAEVAIKAAEANAQLYVQAKQIAIEAAKTSAQVAAQLGAAAFNAIHFSNSNSWSSSGSQSYAESVSFAVSSGISSTDSYSESKSV